jgi:HD-like signal output (HDOD) protein
MISFADPSKPDSDHLRTAFLAGLLLDHLPPFPAFLRQFQCILNDCTIDLEKACVALGSHPAVCGNFMRIAGMAEPNETALPLDHLILLLGRERAWTVAVASFVMAKIDNDRSLPVLRRIARFGEEQGGIAATLALLTEDEAPEQAYVSGFLSIIGLLPLIDMAPLQNDCPAWIGISPAAIAAQRGQFGTDCVELACWIRLLWQLPLEPHEIMPAELDAELHAPQGPPPVRRQVLMMPQRSM